MSVFIYNEAHNIKNTLVLFYLDGTPSHILEFVFALKTWKTVNKKSY